MYIVDRVGHTHENNRIQGANVSAFEPNPKFDPTPNFAGRDYRGFQQANSDPSDPYDTYPRHLHSGDSYTRDYSLGDPYFGGSYSGDSYAGETYADYSYSSSLGTQSYPYYPPSINSVNKHFFVWVGAGLFGWVGADRFMRGQVGTGLFKLFIGSWITLGMWPFVDWVVAMVKAYGQAYGTSDRIFFDLNGEYIH